VVGRLIGRLVGLMALKASPGVKWVGPRLSSDGMGLLKLNRLNQSWNQLYFPAAKLTSSLRRFMASPQVRNTDTIHISSDSMRQFLQY
jgi:hypothetical protein